MSWDDEFDEEYDDALKYEDSDYSPPESGDMPGMAKRVGKMIKPAKRAMSVSEKETHPAEETKLSFLLM